MPRYDVAARNAEIAERYRAGQTSRVIAAAFGMGRPAVKEVIKVLREQGVDLPRRATPAELAQARAQAVIAAYATGLSYTEIAQACGTSRDNVSNILNRARAQGVDVGPRREAVRSRLEPVAALGRDGWPAAAIAERLGISIRHTNHLLAQARQAGLIDAHHPRLQAPRIKAEPPPLTAEVLAVLAEGLSGRAMAARLGIGLRAVRAMALRARNEGLIDAPAVVRRGPRARPEVSATATRVAALLAEGRTFAEAADVLGLTKGQVAGIMFRARQQGDAVASAPRPARVRKPRDGAPRPARAGTVPKPRVPAPPRVPRSDMVAWYAAQPRNPARQCQMITAPGPWIGEGPAICGAEVVRGRSWCAACCAVVFNAPPARIAA